MFAYVGSIQNLKDLKDFLDPKTNHEGVGLEKLGIFKLTKFWRGGGEWCTKSGAVGYWESSFGHIYGLLTTQMCNEFEEGILQIPEPSRNVNGAQGTGSYGLMCPIKGADGPAIVPKKSPKPEFEGFPVSSNNPDTTLA